MIVALDANCLVAWSSRNNPDNVARLDELLKTVSDARGKIIIPVPCLAEYLVHLGDATEAWFAALERKSSVVLAPFDKRAAYECALIDRNAISNGSKRAGRLDAWQKIKIDRQVIAIAKNHSAKEIISEDKEVRAEAISIGLRARALDELTLPDSARQNVIPLEPMGDQP
ncbi:hypothetical protein ACVTTK_05265 [Alcaligenes nematophilus]